MTLTSHAAAVKLGEECFLTASLEFVRDCAARADFIELGLRTTDGVWTWCVAGSTDCEPDDQPTLAMTLGRYGIHAREVDGNVLGYALLNNDAVRAILAGCPVYVDCRLVE